MTVAYLTGCLLLPISLMHRTNCQLCVPRLIYLPLVVHQYQIIVCTVRQKLTLSRFLNGGELHLNPHSPNSLQGLSRRCHMERPCSKTRKTRVSISSSPLQSESLRRSPNLTNCLSPMTRSSCTNNCTPFRKRGFPFHVDRTLDGEDLGANRKGKL